MLSLGSASITRHIRPRQTNPNGIHFNDDRTMTDGRRHREPAERPTRRAVCVQHVHAKATDSTPRAAQCCALVDSCPEGNHSVLKPTRTDNHDPKAALTRKPSLAHSSAHNRTRSPPQPQVQRPATSCARTGCTVKGGPLPTERLSQASVAKQPRFGEKRQSAREAGCFRFLTYPPVSAVAWCACGSYREHFHSTTNQSADPKIG